MNKVIVKLQDIGKIFNAGEAPFIALHDINLSITHGEYVAILGPSGSGKSTLMQIIGCLSTSTTGKYILSGEEVSTLSSDKLARIRNRYIGFIFQRFNLMPQMSVVGNVALPLMYRGIKTKEREEQAKEVLKQVGLAKYFNHKSNELSGGQQQRVAIARALITKPELILADEPTGNLDSKTGSEIIDMFGELNAQGKTVIIVTHDTILAQKMGKTIEIYDGTIECRG